jgi:hypothetical protein
MTPDAAHLVTYLMDAVEPRPEARDGLRAGHAVQLRPRADGRAVEAWSAELGRLGCLPPDVAAMLLGLMPGASLTGEVSALVPRPGRPGGTRIHIRVAGLDAGLA